MKKGIVNLPILFSLLCTVIGLFSACSRRTSHDDVILTVSIAPLKYIVETITGGDFHIEVLVPPGSSPESYAPSASQVVNMDNSRILFSTGLLDMEQEIISRISPGKVNVVNLSAGIPLKTGSSKESARHGHNHGTDPHIWTSPKQLKVMASNAYAAIKKEFPDSVKYETAYDSLQRKLQSVEEYVRERTSASPTRCFFIYHPALTYYAEDYSLCQIALENEGKEPSAAHLNKLVSIARENGIRYILYQRQFPKETVKSIAEDVGAVPVEIDPLREDILDEIIRITDLITAQ